MTSWPGIAVDYLGHHPALTYMHMHVTNSVHELVFLGPCCTRWCFNNPLALWILSRISNSNCHPRWPLLALTGECTFSSLWSLRHLELSFPASRLEFPPRIFEELSFDFSSSEKFPFEPQKMTGCFKQAGLWLGCLKTVSEIVGSFQFSFEPLNHVFSRDQFARLAGIPADFGGRLRAPPVCRFLSQTAVLWVCSPGSCSALQPCRDSSGHQGHTWRPRVSLDKPSKVRHSTETSVITPS